MNKLQTALIDAGYAVCNYNYPSRKGSIEELAFQVIDDALLQCRHPGLMKVHFVTHSLGGIILRVYLKQSHPEGLGKVVMLSPPNQGTELADFFGHNPFCCWLLGPTVSQLGTDYRGLPGTLGPVDFELGIITGRRSVNPLLSLLIEGVDDGKVSVSSARLDGMKEFLVVDASHPFIMRNDQVIMLVVRFLRFGSFYETAAENRQ